ncbi:MULTISPECIES: HIT family protein [Kocuria]|uniref:HIT family protein n=1 Tax=Kocuria rhizophila (strain ATCC 9341 / DSM 348 / NBRC 103217 / DC2201) TaxID=378753 RepID=B2GIM4_KOCRD|nr:MULTISPECIES: HIT domain-containing protein [Kocuria]HBH55295.1 HIT domain-containing protein [Kocuria sp.]ASE10416.1 HIT domain-containing protein [Kocuria rhizophila]MBK4120570.1 HIT domain-containing protein [Kocuria rhizophila]MCC5671766.1 HIT domain-containing protein [Kocuria rhizophila]MCC5674437.1 HIT domain-containing protein [Kocuria rhizophila]
MTERDAAASGGDGVTRDEFEVPGVPDGFQRLWTPHRLAYVRGEDTSVEQPPGCPFCNAPERSDEDSLIVHRGEHCFAVLNLFPYNPGHVLVCPYRHVAELDELTDEELWELNTLTRTAVHVIREIAHPAAFNVGLNLGSAAGGSLAEHLHQHVVPRWTGDANFMPVIAHTKPLIQTLGSTREDIAAAWPQD